VHKFGVNFIRVFAHDRANTQLLADRVKITSDCPATGIGLACAASPGSR
jgi:hypothetical protein